MVGVSYNRPISSKFDGFGSEATHAVADFGLLSSLGIARRVANSATRGKQLYLS